MISRRGATPSSGLIVLGAVITGGAYVLASLGRTATLPANIGPFLGVVLGLLRRRPPRRPPPRPAADAILLPLAALLNGIGYVIIARLDQRARRRCRRSWTARRHRRLRRSRCSSCAACATSSATATRSPSSASACCCCRSCPASAATINGARIWVSLGPINFQPGEFAKIVAGHLLRVVPRREARAARRDAAASSGRSCSPTSSHLGPVAARVGRLARRDDRPRRTSARRCCSSPCSS